MSETLKALEQLVTMAIGAKGAQRKELFAAVTDLYLTNSQKFDDRERDLFGEVIGVVLFDVEPEERQALSEDLAAHDVGPLGLARRLLNDEPMVALPLLKTCAWLNETELSVGLSDRSTSEIEAIAQRDRLNEQTLSSLIDLGSMTATSALLCNPDLKLNEVQLRRIIDTLSDNDGDLTSLVKNIDIPPQRLAEIFFLTTHGHRCEILDALKVDEGASTNTKVRLGSATTTERDLVDLLRQEDLNKFRLSFSQAIGIGDELAQRVLDDEGAEALAVACRSRDFQRATFSTFALLVKSTQRRTPTQITRLMSLYESLNSATAERVIGLWNGDRCGETSESINAA